MDNETLFRYFSAKTTEEEERRINDWLLGDVENEKKLRSAYDLWEAMLFKGYDSASKTPSKRRRNIRRWGLAVLNAADYRLNIIKRYAVGTKICYVQALVNKHCINNIFSVRLY